MFFLNHVNLEKKTFGSTKLDKKEKGQEKRVLCSMIEM
jgi:hypothetical protein